MIESESEVAQSCPTLCYPMDCSLPGSTVHGIFQARILEWVAISFSRRSSWPRDRTWVSCVVGRCFPIWATRDWEITNVDRLHLNVTRSHVSFFLFFTALGPHCFVWLQQMGLLFAAVHRLLLVVASLVVEHRLQAHGLQQSQHMGLVSCGSWALEHWLNSCGTWA